MYKNIYVNEWVEQMAKMTQPDSVVWIDGSEEERERLTKQAVSTGEMMELNQEKLPGCLYHRTAENDVARVEHLTFICTSKKEDAGPTNNWMEKSAAYAKLGTLFEGCMKGRTMYVIPYIMGPAFSEFSRDYRQYLRCFKYENYDENGESRNGYAWRFSGLCQRPPFQG